jgi:hypothetical protein
MNKLTMDIIMSNVEKTELLKEMAKVTAKDEISEQLNSSFSNIYGCTRVWKAWSYDTMTLDDFPPFQKGDEAYDEMKVKFDQIIKSVKNTDELHEFFIDLDYDLYYNSDIESNFESNFFHQDYLDYVDLSTLMEKIKAYQALEIATPEPELKKSVTSKAKLS